MAGATHCTEPSHGFVRGHARLRQKTRCAPFWRHRVRSWLHDSRSSFTSLGPQVSNLLSASSDPATSGGVATLRYVSTCSMTETTLTGDAHGLCRLRLTPVEIALPSWRVNDSLKLISLAPRLAREAQRVHKAYGRGNQRALEKGAEAPRHGPGGVVSIFKKFRKEAERLCAGWKRQSGELQRGTQRFLRFCEHTPRARQNKRTTPPASPTTRCASTNCLATGASAFIVSSQGSSDTDKTSALMRNASSTVAAGSRTGAASAIFVARCVSHGCCKDGAACMCGGSEIY